MSAKRKKTSWPKHPRCLSDEPGNIAVAVAAFDVYHDIEAGVVERQFFSVACHELQPVYISVALTAEVDGF